MRRLVLVADPLRPGQPGAVPEVAAEELVPREDVAEELRQVVDGDRAAVGVQPVHPRQPRPPVALQPDHVAGHQGRARLLRQREQQLERPRRHQVVGVAEPEVLTAGVPDPLVASGTEAAVLDVHHPHPGVPGGVGIGDRPGVVGGAVVDHHDLELAQGLPEQAVEAGGEVRRHVVRRDHHAHPRRGLTALEHPRTVLRSNRGDPRPSPAGSTAIFPDSRREVVHVTRP